MNTEEIIEGYLGDTEVNSIYQGSELVWIKYVGNRYLIGGTFTTYSPNDNLLEDKKNSISIVQTYNGKVYDDRPPFDGIINNIKVTLDNSTQIDPEFSVMKINRLNSSGVVRQVDSVLFPEYNIEPGKTMEMSFWYYGTYGTAIHIYSTEIDGAVYIERWDASTNAYITNNSRFCTIPVTTNTWQYIKLRARNIHTTLSKRSFAWLRLHDNETNATLSHHEYWKITCLKLWHVESIAKNKIIRLNDDDSIDNTWYNNNSYTSGTFYQLMYDNINKKVYAAGDPALDGGLVRYNLDGTKDTSFNIGTGFNNSVRSIIIDNTNSKIYVGGTFTTYKGSTQNRLIRLNMDGSKDISFNIGSGFSDGVLVINMDTINSKLYVGGVFSAYNGTTKNRICRLNLDGSLDNSFNVGTGFNSNVWVINMDTINQKLYVSGDFTTYNGTTQNKICRLNMDGSLDSAFDIGTGFNANVMVINIDNTNSKIYVGGYFRMYNGNVQNRLVRLNMDGSLDISFNIGTGFNFINTVVYDILVDNEKNKIYIAGEFTKYNDQQQKYLARLNMDGSLDNTFNIQLGTTAVTLLKYTE